MAKYILVGANPIECASLHPGGLLTLSIGLLDYAKRQGYCIEIINTARSGLVYEPIMRRLKFGADRALSLFHKLRAGDCDGVIIFSGAGFSFYERIILSIICKWFGVNDLFVIVDGWFIKVSSANFIKRNWIGLLLRIPNKLAASGSRWSDLFRELGIKSNRVARINYWLSESFLISENPKAVTASRLIGFIFVGWMIREKGVFELLAAIEKLRKVYNFSFTFIGGGPLLEDVRKKIADEGWAEDVSALGWVLDDKLQNILSSADVFVLPSYAEGFPMSLIEAFSKGLPAICSDVGGISDSLQNGVNGYLIPPKQVEPLIVAMERYLKNPQLISEHSRAALKIAKTNHDAKANCTLCFDALK